MQTERVKKKVLVAGAAQRTAYSMYNDKPFMSIP
jgi:hypothetical protein